MLPELHDPALLAAALTHPSFVAEHPGTTDYERLEFLGDSVLGLVTAELLYAEHPDWRPEQLSVNKHQAVRTRTFASFARTLGLASRLRLGRGARLEGVDQQDKVLENVFEAVVGALYLDQGLDAVRVFVAPLLRGALAEPAPKPAKTALQEYCQARRLPLAYHIPESAPPFTCEVRVANLLVGEGAGRSKREAATMAAERALLHLAAQPA